MSAIFNSYHRRLAKRLKISLEDAPGSEADILRLIHEKFCLTRRLEAADVERLYLIRERDMYRFRALLGWGAFMLIVAGALVSVALWAAFSWGA